jgi:hypothetical protein
MFCSRLRHRMSLAVCVVLGESGRRSGNYTCPCRFTVLAMSSCTAISSELRGAPSITPPNSKTIRYTSQRACTRGICHELLFKMRSRPPGRLLSTLESNNRLRPLRLGRKAYLSIEVRHSRSTKFGTQALFGFSASEIQLKCSSLVFTDVKFIGAGSKVAHCGRLHRNGRQCSTVAVVRTNVFDECSVVVLRSLVIIIHVQTQPGPKSLVCFSMDLTFSILFESCQNFKARHDTARGITRTQRTCVDFACGVGIATLPC